MANDGRFLNLTSGQVSQESAINVSAGVGDAAKIAKLDSAGKFDITMMPAGVGSEARSIISSENLTAGNAVNVYNNAGTLNVRKADGAAAGKPADGFVIANVTSPAAATVYLEEATISGLSGFTPGADVFLDVTTPGLITATVPVGAGKVAQLLGKALSATEVLFRRGVPITLA